MIACLLSFLPLVASPAPATTEDGIRAILRGDYPAGARILEQLAEDEVRPDPVAQFFLAALYHTGHGVAGDLSRACGLFLSAAGHEHPLREQSLTIVTLIRGQLGAGAARLCVADAIRQDQPVAPPSVASAAASVVKGQGGSADGIVALVRGDYQRAVGILTPIAEHWASQDAAAQFFLAGLYQTGRGVPRDPLRACALYMSAGSQHLNPFSGQAGLLFAALAGHSPEFDQDCQRLGVIGFDHGFESTTFDLGPGHSVEWTLAGATVTYQHVSRREESQFAQRGSRFLPLHHTELATGPMRSLPRHFIEIFLCRPSSAKGPWTLQWHVIEVVRDQMVRIHDSEGLATVEGDTPPPPDAFDPREYAVVRLDNEGHPEWAIFKGPDAGKRRIESDAERREVRDLAATRKAAMDGIDWGERYDVYRQPAVTYVDAEGCGRFQVYGWSADRAEALVVRVSAPELKLSAESATYELTRQSANLRVDAHVYAEPQRAFHFCSDLGPTPAGPIEPQQWRAVAGSLTIELGAGGIRAHAPHLRRVTVTLSNLVLENASGMRARVTQTVGLAAIAGNPLF